MALFGDKKDKKEISKIANIEKASSSDKISSATIITACMNVTGNLEGSDTIHIGGTVTGNITVSNTLIIGKSGVVKGNIEAKNAIINGELQGTIKSDNLEIMQTGKVSHQIDAKHLIIDGTVEGTIIASDSIKVQENANIQAKTLKSRSISVHGRIQGTVIASEILEIGRQGFVEGQITVKNIKTEEGGRMIGTMSTYQEENSKIEETNKTKENPEDKTTSPKAKNNSKDDFFNK